MFESFDAVIVGGGHNGLIAACYLAKAGQRVAVLEKNSEFGGATASVYAFSGVSAKLSRYSYLVALLPDQIIADLNLNFKTLSRKVSSYTPHSESGILINRIFDDESRSSISKFTGISHEADAWQKFYNRIAEFAEKVAPTMLRPLPTESEIREMVGEELWQELVVQPLSETLAKYFSNDVVKGIVLTDGLIGTFASATERAANICFLYHLIGNGSGEWKVPVGGMGVLVNELLALAKSLGVILMPNSNIQKIVDSGEHVIVETNSNNFQASVVIAGCSPHELAKLTGDKPPNSLDGSQLKINMVLTKLPRLRSGIDPKVAFSGTFHIDESYQQLEAAFEAAKAGQVPSVIPAEMYCHTLTDPSILSDELREAGFHTLTVFALHTPASLFDRNHDESKSLVSARVLAGLNKYLIDSIESCLALDATGKPCIEIKTPQELEREIGLPRGNIFHGDLEFPWKTNDDPRKWGVETKSPRIFIGGAGAVRGGGVSGISGHNAAMAALERLTEIK
jgi:phytoene dehydrogenase-like protein